MTILTNCAYIAAAARTGAFHPAHCVAPYKTTQELTHQKPSANRGAIAPNLPIRRHARLTASDIKPLAHSKYRRRRRGAPIPASARTGFSTCGSFPYFRLRTAVIIFSFNVQALKSFAFNFQYTGFNLHHRSWYRTKLMSITSYSYGVRSEILDIVFDIREHRLMYRNWVLQVSISVELNPKTQQRRSGNVLTVCR